MSKGYRKWKSNITELISNPDKYGVPEWRLQQLNSIKPSMRNYRKHKRFLDRLNKDIQKNNKNIGSRNKVLNIRMERNHESMRMYDDINWLLMYKEEMK